MNLNELSIFDMISTDGVHEMTECMDGRIQSFQPKDTIMTYSDHLEKIGLLLEGSAYLYTLDYEGRCSILEYFQPNDVFGEMFMLPVTDQGYFIEAETACKVFFIPYEYLVKRCEHACQHHSQLVSNLFQLTAYKSRQQTMHINILSQRNMRSKLWMYFSYQYQIQRKNPITVPMSYTSLANYLCVDRSAMMRELKQMRLHGMIETDGSIVKLISEV